MKHIFSVKMPDIGEGVVEGEVISWLKNIDDTLEQDTPVIIVMTDKATVELPAPYPGKLVKQYYKQGEMAVKGKPLYDIELEEGQQVVGGRGEPVKPQATTREKEGVTEKKPCPLEKAAKEQGKALATPPVRHLASRLGINLAEVTCARADGRLTEEDLRAYVDKKQSVNVRASKRAAPAIHVSTPLVRFEDDEEKPLIGIRNLTAEKMVESKYIVPHFSYFDTLDATRLVQIRENSKESAAKEGIKLTYLPFIIRALSLSLQAYPQLNSSVDLGKNSLVIHKQQNIGIAIRTPLGLIVPVVKNVEKLGLHGIIREYEALKNRALSGKLDPNDMKDSTITITNFGTLGTGVFATPIINYPEVAILGIARIRKQPVVKNDALVIREMLNTSWSFDHRVIDGDAAAEFSTYFNALLENPGRLL